MRFDAIFDSDQPVVPPPQLGHNIDRYNDIKICQLTHIIRRGKYSIRKILNWKVVFGRNWNEGHLNMTTTNLSDNKTTNHVETIVEVLVPIALFASCNPRSLGTK